MNTTIRPREPGDFPALVALQNATEPYWPTTLERFEHQERHRDPKRHHAAFVLERDGKIVGSAGTGHDEFAFEEGKFVMGVRVHPDHRRQGFGGRLYDHLRAHLAPMQPRLLVAFGTERQPEGVRFAKTRGFTPTWKRYDFSLDTTGFDFAPHGALEASVRDAGIAIKSLSQLERETDAVRQLYELDWVLFQDVPMGVAFTKRSFEQWCAEEVDAPGFLRDACMIATDPRRDDALTGGLVGYTCLMRTPSGVYVIGMTGTLREYRGRGVGKALKLQAMRYVQAHGDGEIRTTNDPPNRAMLGMNAALGFKREPAGWRFEQALDGRVLEPFDESKYL